MTRGRILLAVIALSAFATILFGLRSYGSFLLLRSANEAGWPQLSTLRAWMTLDHVAPTIACRSASCCRASACLRTQAATRRCERSPISAACRASTSRGRSSTRSGNHSLHRRANETPLASPTASSRRSLSTAIGVGVDAAVGAIGLPLPIGVAAVLAGSLAALGTLRWEWAGLIAVLASFADDIVAFAIGRAVSDAFLNRHGRCMAAKPA